jgi:hypothetical protein
MVSTATLIVASRESSVMRTAIVLLSRLWAPAVPGRKKQRRATVATNATAALLITVRTTSLRSDAGERRCGVAAVPRDPERVGGFERVEVGIGLVFGDLSGRERIVDRT